MKKHVVKRYFDHYFDGITRHFDTEEQAIEYWDKKKEEETRHCVTWEYRGLEEVEE